MQVVWSPCPQMEEFVGWTVGQLDQLIRTEVTMGLYPRRTSSKSKVQSIWPSILQGSFLFRPSFKVPSVPSCNFRH